MPKIPVMFQITPNPVLSKMVSDICELGGYDNVNDAIKEAIRRYYFNLTNPGAGDADFIDPIVEDPTPPSIDDDVESDIEDALAEPATAEEFIESLGGGRLIEKNGKKYRQYNDGALEKDEMLPDRYQ